MKFIDSKFMRDICNVTKQSYDNGWDERNGGNISIRITEDELKDFCKKLPRAEFEDSERAKSVAIKAMRVVLLALGYDTDFVENEFRKEVEKVIVVKRNI